mmetsp:Transcript_26207/g.59817  ORF Transcript_26207/g.59817 Transcript_26207/m.59817 type:complete len:230 (-) Transcript_26207:29-718(-)
MLLLGVLRPRLEHRDRPPGVDVLALGLARGGGAHGGLGGGIRGRLAGGGRLGALLSLVGVADVEPLEESFDAAHAQVAAAVRLVDGDLLDVEEAPPRRPGILPGGEPVEVPVAERAVVVAEGGPDLTQLRCFAISELVELPEGAVSHAAIEVSYRLVAVQDRDKDGHDRLVLVVLAERDPEAVRSRAGQRLFADDAIIIAVAAFAPWWRRCGGQRSGWGRAVHLFSVIL